MEAIAVRAQVGKPTIYRSWPNAQAVAMAALIDIAPETAPADADAPGRPLDALRGQLCHVVDVFASRVGRSAATLVASATRDTELFKSFRSQVILASRTQGRVLLERAAMLGEIRADADIDAALDLIYGPIFFRVLVGHEGLDETFADCVLDTVLDGLRPR